MADHKPHEHAVAPKVEEKAEEKITPAERHKLQLQAQITDKLNSVNGMESNIGHSDKYWDWINEFRGL